MNISLRYLVAALVVVLFSGAATSRVYVEPTAGIQPVLQLIQQAKKTIDIEQYEITDRTLRQALTAAGRRGVKVRIILERHPYFARSDFFAGELKALSGPDLSVRAAPGRFEYDHAKFMLVDNSAELIGTANYSYDAFHRNREYLFGADDPKLAQALSEVFSADWAGKPAGAAPRATLILSPDAYPAITALFNRGRHTIQVETEEMPSRSIVKYLLGRAKKGLSVSLLLANQKSNYSGKKNGCLYQQLYRSKNVAVGVVSSPYLHAKLIIVDDETAYLGSGNLTFTSLTRNREVGLLLGRGSLGPLEETFEQDYRKAKTPKFSCP